MSGIMHAGSIKLRGWKVTSDVTNLKFNYQDENQMTVAPQIPQSPAYHIPFFGAVDGEMTNQHWNAKESILNKDTMNGLTKHDIDIGFDDATTCNSWKPPTYDGKYAYQVVMQGYAYSKSPNLIPSKLVCIDVESKQIVYQRLMSEICDDPTIIFARTDPFIMGEHIYFVQEGQKFIY